MPGRELRVPEERVQAPDDVLMRRARLAICAEAVDADEALMLMRMTGIAPGMKWVG